MLIYSEGYFIQIITSIYNNTKQTKNIFMNDKGLGSERLLKVSSHGL